MFLIVISFCAIPILIAQIKIDTEGHSIFGALVFFMAVAIGSLSYAVRRINWLLIEKDEELRYRSLRIGEEIVLKNSEIDNNTNDD